MNSTIDFSSYEINALNKLLGQIKSEAYLDADEINFFALSPFIISAFEKIHKEYMNQVRHQLETGDIQTIGQSNDLDPLKDFQLTDKHHIGDRGKRIKNLNNSGQEYLRSMDRQKREEYCDLIFAPFKPTEKQRQDIITILESFSNKLK